MIKTSKTRFRDDRKGRHHFADEFLIVCPQCGQCAHVTRLPTEEQSLFGSRRLLCPFCGHNKDMTGNRISYKAGLDWYFHLPLWLSVQCAGNQLWAFNHGHLLWLEQYVQATLREQRPDPTWGWSNSSAANRLSKWIKSAKNREAILRCILKLKRKVAESTLQ